MSSTHTFVLFQLPLSQGSSKLSLKVFRLFEFDWIHFIETFNEQFLWGEIKSTPFEKHNWCEIQIKFPHNMHSQVATAAAADTSIWVIGLLSFPQCWQQNKLFGCSGLFIIHVGYQLIMFSSQLWCTLISLERFSVKLKVVNNVVVKISEGIMNLWTHDARCKDDRDQFLIKI